VTTATVEEFEKQRPRLLGLAYRLLGEVGEAEDAVQDAYLRWSAADHTRIAAPPAWLAKVVTNLCLNRLMSARARREAYLGPWLPEPVLTGLSGNGAGMILGPLETVEQRDSVSLALLMLMETLTPAERAVFVLREAFSYSHQEIAEILDLTEAGSRQLQHRARQRLGDPERRFEPVHGQWQRLVERFLGAAVEGDVAGLTEMLAEDVIAWSDGGGKASAARRPIFGRDKVLRSILGLLARHADGMEISIEEVNGAPGLVGRADGALTAIVAFELVDDTITGLYSVLNPDKLALANRRPGAT
jgi:RNA polymerase sigma-70 factor (ECF subfamily)